MPCATRLIHCAWFEQWYPRLKCTITTCQKCSIIYSHLSLPRQKLPWTLRRVGTQFSATHAENCQWEQGVLIICFFSNKLANPLKTYSTNPSCQEFEGADLDALTAACELALQRMKLYQEDAVEASTLTRASRASGKDRPWMWDPLYDHFFGEPMLVEEPSTIVCINEKLCIQHHIMKGCFSPNIRQSDTCQFLTELNILFKLDMHPTYEVLNP